MYRDKVFVSPPLSHDVQIEIEDSEWLFLQGHKGSKLGGNVLSPETRNELVRATNLYASSLRNVEHTESLKVILTKIVNWINATQLLQEEVWKEKEENDLEWFTLANRIARRQMTFESIQESFLCSSRIDLEKQFPLALLSRILKGSTLTAVCVHTNLQQEWAAQQRNIWFIWAAVIFSILGNVGISVRDPKRKNS